MNGIEFYREELRDLAAAWAALALAFTLFVVSTSGRVGSPMDYASLLGTGLFVRVFLLATLTVGVGFLLHELAHKVVAVRFGQVAHFRADYTMLGLAVFAALAGFLFAAPGAVYHAGNVSERENGLIAIAGPATNVALGLLLFPLLFLPGFAGEVGQLGVTINFVLAGFNMIPFGPLDGRTVLSWSKVVFGVAFFVCAGLALFSLVVVGFPY